MSYKYRDEKGRFTKGANPWDFRDIDDWVSPKKIELDEDLLRELYLERKLSSVEIGRRLGCDYKTILRRMKEYNIPVRNQSNAQKLRNWKISEEQKEKMKEGYRRYYNNHQDRIGFSGENHWNWKGGITRENRRLRGVKEMKDWRNDVFERDSYTCQYCGKKNCYLEAHHIYKMSKYPELMFELDNGITLCKNCHNLTKWNEEEFIELSLMRLNDGDLEC